MYDRQREIRPQPEVDIQVLAIASTIGFHGAGAVPSEADFCWWSREPFRI